MMQPAPLCKLCGLKHWSRELCPALGGVLGTPGVMFGDISGWMPPEEQAVTNTSPFDVIIPPVREVSVTQSRLVPVTLAARNKGGRPKKEHPLTPAERQRRRRQRLKEAAHVNAPKP